MEFKFDYGTVHSSSATPSAVPLWAAIDGRVSPLAGDEVVFFDPATGRSHVMTQQVLQALDLCRAFRPLSEHVEAVAAGLPGLQGKQTAVKPVLESLQSRGLLISDDAWLRRLGDVAARPQANVAGLFVRACNRPQQLAALLDSLASRAPSLASAQRLVVVDDSPDPDAVAANGRHLRAFAATWPQPVHHVTPALWREILAALCADLPSQASALSGVLLTPADRRGSGGSGRNLITLLAAGCRYLILDEDNLLPLNQRVPASDCFDPQPAASTVRTYASHAEALAVGTPDEDAIDWHLRMCGRSLGELVGAGKALALESHQLLGFAPSRVPALSGAARVALTVNGHRGGSCSSSLHWLLSLDAKSRAGLCATEASYLAGRGDASVWAGYDRVHATRMATVSPFAVDNSQLMPCTSSRGRVEDLLYTALVSAGDGGSLQLLTPFAAGHLPEAGRDRSQQLGAPRTAAFGFCIGELVGSMAGELQSEFPADRLRAVAGRLEDFAGGSSASLQAYLREYLVYERSLLLRQLQDALPAAQDAPAALRQDILAQIELNARAVVERGVPRFIDEAANASADDCASRFRAELLTLSAGLRAWPAAWDIALSQRENWLERARLRA